MILSKEEAICLVLGFSRNNDINSMTKLNKLIARLNLHLIPVDISFSLNKYGSFNPELQGLSSNQYFEKYAYNFKGKEISGFKIKPEGQILFRNTSLPKIQRILKPEEVEDFGKEIFELSMLNAGEISGDEHKKLFVDVEDRYKLVERINVVYADFFDLYQNINEVRDDTIEGIRLKALIEYCFNLTRFLKEKRFKKIEEEGYRFDDYMFDYYFLYNLEKLVPLINTWVKGERLDKLVINKYYQYFINSVREKYPFSLDNPDLNKLVAQ